MENKSIEKWIDLAENHPIPVLKHTINELRHLCRKENIPLKEITHVVERDPGLVIHILRSSNNREKKGLASEITHVNQAFRLMGTDQLTRLPDALPAAGDVLNDKNKARLFATFNRAYHAARFATDWAALRRDMTPDEVFAAAQLHFMGEMVLSIHEPELLEKITALRLEDHIATEEAQFMVLGFTLNELTKKIAERLKFPQLVTDALSAENAKFPRAYGIMLGVQYARTITNEGWYSQNTYNIQKEIAELMNQSIDKVISRSHTIAAEVAREIPQYDTEPAAKSLVLIREDKSMDRQSRNESPEDTPAICLIPQLPILSEALKKISTLSQSDINIEELIQFIVTTMHDGIGLNRVVFCRYNQDDGVLQGNVFKGAENDPVFNRFSIKTKKKTNNEKSNIFSLLLTKAQAVLINESNRQKFWPLVPVEVQKLINTNSFIAMSIYVKEKPYGLFYADRHTSACQIENKSYNYFKKLCTHTSTLLEKIK